MKNFMDKDFLLSNEISKNYIMNIQHYANNRLSLPHQSTRDSRR